MSVLQPHIITIFEISPYVPSVLLYVQAGAAIQRHWTELQAAPPGWLWLLLALAGAGQAHAHVAWMRTVEV